MEKIITSIQTNSCLNAMKSAIISIAPMNVAVSILMLIGLGYENAFHVTLVDASLKIKLYEVYVYLMTCIISYKIYESMKTTFQDIDPMIGVGALVLLIVPGFNQNTIQWLPILSMFLSLALSYFMVILSKIRMKTQAVPPAVVNTLNGLIMPVLLLILALTLGMVVPNLFHALGNILISITGIFGTYVFLIIVIVAILGIWVKGLHGIATVSSLMRPFWYFMMVMNTFSLLNGVDGHYVATESFMQWTVWLGGSGCTIGLSIALRFLAKSRALKQLGKDSINANLFNINENIVFGVPLADNPMFRIPFFLAPILCGTLSYWAIATDLVRGPSLVMPWVLPTPIGFYFATLFDIKAFLLGLVLIVISFVVYLPFFIKYDKQLVLEEQQ